MPPSDTKLADVQAFLASAFRREAHVWDDPALEAACALHVTGNDRLSPDEQVDIYRRQFWLRHVDSMIEDYPGLRFVLGDDGFERFAHAYLAAYPPKTPSLRDLGADVLAFAATYDGFGDRRGVALDMLRYEHAFVDLFDGADVPPLDPAKLAAMPEDGWEKARIKLHPLLVRMSLEHPVNRLRTALKREEPDLALPAPEPVLLVLYRELYTVTYREIEPLAFRLLDELARGKPLVGACEALASAGDAKADELEAKVGAWFQQWTADRWIVDVELP